MNLNEIKDYLDQDWKRTANYIEDSLKTGQYCHIPASNCGR